MAKEPTVLKNADVLTKVIAKSTSCVSWTDSKLSKERERVTNYLNGVLPKRSSEGSSSYVSSDVYDSVEMARAQLLETFAGGDHIAVFDPDQDMNADVCRVATEYASYIIFRQNEGYNVFGGVIYDGLTARAGVAKVYWEEKYRYSEETFEGLSEEDAYALASQDEVDDFEATEDEGTKLFSGTLVRKYDDSQVTIANVPPEEFLITAQATSILTSDYTGHRTPKTKAELIAMGFAKKIVDELPYDDAKALQFSPEVIARQQATRANDASDEPIQDELAYVVYYESYVRMQIDSNKGVRLYKICHTATKLLDDPQEVDKAPFLAYVPLPVPHVFYGNNFAQRVIPTQNARTVLFRGVLDHTAITTNARYFVVNGGLMNPRELLDNRLGGIVNVRRPDSVTTMKQESLNPFVFNTLTLLTDNNEKSTGVSALSQGLNKDAISTQNSKGLVDNLMKASGQRGKIMARNFVNNFFVPLMIEAIRLAILHEKKEKVIEVAGSPLTVKPQSWTERTTCSVSMHLGYGEKDTAVQKHTEAYKLLKGNPLFTMQDEYDLIHDTMKLAGFAKPYVSTPDKVPPPQPDPLKLMELKIKDKSADAAMLQAQASQNKDNRLFALDQSKLEMAGRDQAIKALDHDRTHDRQDAETASRIQVADKELELEEQAMANQAAETRINANVNPNP